MSNDKKTEAALEMFFDDLAEEGNKLRQNHPYINEEGAFVAEVESMTLKLSEREKMTFVCYGTFKVTEAQTGPYAEGKKYSWVKKIKPNGSGKRDILSMVVACGFSPDDVRNPQTLKDIITKGKLVGKKVHIDATASAKYVTSDGKPFTIVQFSNVED